MMTRQQGASLPGVLFVVVMVGMIGLLGIKLFPTYYQDFKVKSALESLQRDPEGLNSPQAIMNAMQRRLQVESVTAVDRNNISITRERGVLLVEVIYEVRQPWFANIDLVSYFEHRVEIPAR